MDTVPLHPVAPAMERHSRQRATRHTVIDPAWRPSSPQEIPDTGQAGVSGLPKEIGSMPASFPCPRSRACPAIAPWFALIGALLVLPAMAEPGPGAHVHGTAELRVVVDGGQLDIALESPLDNLLGFEHAPRTGQQRAAVRTLADKLRQVRTLFVPTPAAQCSLVSVRLASAALPAELLGEPKPAAAENAGDADGHADLDASFSFKCAEPALLRGVEVGLMTAFTGLRKLNVQMVGPKGQAATVLTPGKRAVAW